MSDGDKIPLLLFSGGLDSTALLQRLHQEGCVDVVAAEVGQHSRKVLAETQARREIIRHLTKHRADEPTHPIFDLGWIKAPSIVDSPGTILTQIAPMLFALLSVVDPRRHSRVLMGYVRGDDAITFRHEIANAWTSLMCFTKNTINVPIEFPLILEDKETLMRELDPELRKLIWVCELPVQRTERAAITACGLCRPCKRHRLTQKNVQPPKLRSVKKPGRDVASNESRDGEGDLKLARGSRLKVRGSHVRR